MPNGLTNAIRASGFTLIPALYERAQAPESGVRSGLYCTSRSMTHRYAFERVTSALLTGDVQDYVSACCDSQSASLHGEQPAVSLQQWRKVAQPQVPGL